jgi:inosine-uridine nucleoside N-ribohydrolase
MLLLSDEITIEGISVVNGVTHIEFGLANLLRLLDASGNRDIPVGIGSSEPLVGNASFPSGTRAEADRLAFLDGLLPRSVKSRPTEPAHELLFRIAATTPAKVVLLCLGPLTNVARGLSTFGQHSLDGFAQTVIMGGSLFGEGNVSPSRSGLAGVAEYNVFVDPTAASVVLNADGKIVLVGTGVTKHVPRAFFLPRLRQIRPRRPEGVIAKAILERARLDFLYDPLAAAIAMSPSIATKTGQYEVRVNSDFSSDLVGQVTATSPGPVEVVLDIDTSSFWGLLEKLLSR